MQEDLHVVSAVVKARQRAHRLIKRIAKALDQKTTATISSDEVLDVALSIPLEIVLSFVIELTPIVQFTGGYVWQYWLSTGGPRWAMKIISDRQKVQISRCHQIISIFDM